MDCVSLSVYSSLSLSLSVFVLCVRVRECIVRV